VGDGVISKLRRTLSYFVSLVYRFVVAAILRLRYASSRMAPKVKR
jgi:hypothetical protein